MSALLDFDVGGVVGIRAIGCTALEAAALERQLGVAAGRLERAPDIELCFVPRLEHEPGLRLIGLADAAFGQRTALLLRDEQGSRVSFALPFEQVGRTIALQCEQGLGEIPLLAALVDATMLSKGFVPLRAAAFVHAGRGVLATGWSESGTTETLLAFMAHGARFVADERLYLAPGGRSMFGLSEPIRIRNWHLASLPELRRRIPWAERMRLSLLELAQSSLSRVATHPLGRARALLQERPGLDVAPGHLFPGSLHADGPDANGRLRPECVLFLVGHERREIVVEPIDPSDVAERMCFSLAEEEQQLAACYRKFRFAFPRNRSELLERAPSLRSELLHAALRGRPAFEVRHPHPVSLTALYRALERVCA